MRQPSFRDWFAAMRFRPLAVTHGAQSFNERFGKHFLRAIFLERLANIRQQHHAQALRVGVVLAVQLGKCNGGALRPVTARDFSNRKKRTPVVRQPIESTGRQHGFARFKPRHVVSAESRQLPAKLGFRFNAARVEMLAQFSGLRAFKPDDD